MSKSTIALEEVGSRIYITGPTYPLRARLRAAGMQWDPSRKGWWTEDRGAAESFLGGARDAAPAAPRSITTDRIGRRTYLRGDTLAVRGYLRSQGCHWDADARAWWIGDDATAQRIAEGAVASPAESAPRKRITRCVGCGSSLDTFTQRRGYRFCSRDCAVEARMGSGWSGTLSDGSWHQGSDD